MKLISYEDSRETSCFLGNLIPLGQRVTIAEIEDAIEDSNDGNELVIALNKLDLIKKFDKDRETDDYVRLKSTDRLGNIHYLKCSKA